jgi:uncharacterized protein YbcI
MADTSILTGSELNAAVTDALVEIQTQHLGRRPLRASTFYHGNVVVTLMYGVLSEAERTLGRNGNEDDVTDLRELFQNVMAPDFRAAVERLSGRKVVALLSATHIEPDVASEVFILDGPL